MHIDLTNVGIMTERPPKTRQKFITEIAAGSFVKRISSTKKPKGGSSIEWVYEGTDDEPIKTNEYLVLSTGEIKTAEEKAETRLGNERNIRIACEKFKWKVRANAEDARLFITLTYEENMTDTKQLYEDFRRFWQRLKGRFGIEGYLVAFEPQERGAWHAHLITIGGEDFISNAQVAKLWGHGFTKTKACRAIADLGNYLTAYLVKLDGKKGSRLGLYPARFRFLRWSKGLKEPTIKKYVGTASDEIDGFIKVSERTFHKEIEGLPEPLEITIQEFYEANAYERYRKEKFRKSQRFKEQNLRNNSRGCRDNHHPVFRPMPIGALYGTPGSAERKSFERV